MKEMSGVGRGEKMEKYSKLIDMVLMEHLCSIEIQAYDPLKPTEYNQIVTIKKQMGNRDGSSFEIDLFNGKGVMDIRFKSGDYNDIETVILELGRIMQMIVDSNKKQESFMENDIRKGKIIEFQGSWMSGIAQLIIEDSETGTTESICCENTSTVRALDDAYGDVIDSNHSLDNDAIFGKQILWFSDGLIMTGFTPAEEAGEELLELYEKNKLERGKINEH